MNGSKSKWLSREIEAAGVCPVCKLLREEMIECLRRITVERSSACREGATTAPENNFCAAHADKAVRISSDLSLAYLYLGAVEGWIEECKAGAAPEVEGECPVCTHLISFEREIVQAIHEELALHATLAMAKWSRGLCVKHFRDVYDLADAALKEQLWEWELNCLQGLAEDLRQFIASKEPAARWRRSRRVARSPFAGAVKVSGVDVLPRGNKKERK